MGRSKIKKLAEFQFNADAAPVDLASKIGNFMSPVISLDPSELGEEKISYLNYFQETNHEDIPIESESLIIIANDLDPQKRDEFENDEKIIFHEIENEQIGPYNYSDLVDIVQDDNENKKVESVEFKIQHSEIRRNEKIKVDDKISTAIELVDLAIEKMPEDYKDKFKLKKTDQLIHPRTKLIDKSHQSIEYINKLGLRILNLLKFKYPDQFDEFPDDEDKFVEWFNKKFKGRKKNLGFKIMCAIVAVRLKTIDIELNNYCGIRMGFDDVGCAWTTHQYLMFLKLRTIDIESDRFLNFLKVAFNFSKIYGGKRLYYLEYIAMSALEDDIFFRSDHHLFAENIGDRWKNENYIEISKCIDDEILRKIKTEIVLSD